MLHFASARVGPSIKVASIVARESTPCHLNLLTEPYGNLDNMSKELFAFMKDSAAVELLAN